MNPVLSRLQVRISDLLIFLTLLSYLRLVTNASFLSAKDCFVYTNTEVVTIVVIPGVVCWKENVPFHSLDSSMQREQFKTYSLKKCQTHHISNNKISLFCQFTLYCNPQAMPMKLRHSYILKNMFSFILVDWFITSI